MNALGRSTKNPCETRCCPTTRDDRSAFAVHLVPARSGLFRLWLHSHGNIAATEIEPVALVRPPPRAARDVRECGIRLITTMIKTPDGRRMAVYKIDERSDAEAAKAQGRRAFPKALKDALIKRDGEQCTLCGGHFPARALQVDHRIPYEIGGEVATVDPGDFMLVCGSCNRAKSWSCENCPNWNTKDPVVCASCLWASPDAYLHIAKEARRRLDLVWEGAEVTDFDRIAADAKLAGAKIRVVIKEILRRHPGN